MSEQERPTLPDVLDTWVITYFGPASAWFKKTWLLAGGGLVCAVGVILVQTLARGTNNAPLDYAAPLTIVFGSVAALLVLTDKVADRHDRLVKEANEATLKELQDDLLRASEETARNSVSDINAVLESAHQAAFMAGVARQTQIAALRSVMVASAVKAVGPGARATYYQLTRTPTGRVLGSPIHATGYGRDDAPDKPFDERVDGGLNIWAMLDRADTEPQVARRGDTVPGLTWDGKAYSAFVSIPVKARGIVFGMLSVNTTNSDAIGGAQRAAIISMARVLALVEALSLGPTALKSLEMSSAATTLIKKTTKNKVTK